MRISTDNGVDIISFNQDKGMIDHIVGYHQYIINLVQSPKTKKSINSMIKLRVKADFMSNLNVDIDDIKNQLDYFDRIKSIIFTSS